MYDLIVIGGGPAGVTAALRASELGARTALIESSHLGGTCTNDGCVPTRVLAKAARLVRDTEQLAHYGLDAPRPSLHFPRLLERTQEIIYRVHEKKQLLNRLALSNVTVHADVGDATFTDPHTLVLPNGTTLQASKFILCAGGRARRIPFPGSDLAMTHSDVWSLTALPHSLAVVGGAATGCQLASIFAAFGTRIHILEVAPRLLALEDEMVSQVIEEAFHRRGISVVTGIGGVESIGQGEDGLTLTYTHQGQPHTLTVEKVVMAVGWPGNIDRLNLGAVGVETERGYVRVDHSLATSVPHIFAAGDITGRMMLVQSATGEGTVAAENAVMGTSSTFMHTIVPHGGFTDPEYASVGLTESRARAEYGVDVAATVIPYADLDRAVIDGYPEGFCKLVVSPQTGQVIGAHVVGEQAVEVIQIVAAGMAAGTRVEQLASLEFAYPTFTAIVGLAARKVMRQLSATPANQPGPVEWEWRST